MNNELFFAQNKPILEDMKIIDIASGSWSSSILLQNGTIENLSLFSDQYSNWSELIEDIWKDAYFIHKGSSNLWISKAMVRVINPTYQILFPIITIMMSALAPSEKPTSVVNASGNINTISGLGISAFKVNLNITSSAGTVQFHCTDTE